MGTGKSRKVWKKGELNSQSLWFTAPSGHDFKIRKFTIIEAVGIFGGLPDVAAFLGKGGSEKDAKAASDRILNVVSVSVVEPKLWKEDEAGRPEDGILASEIPAADLMFLFQKAVSVAGFSPKEAEEIRPL